MEFYTTIQDFTGVYSQQPFMESLRGNAANTRHKKIHWMDCTKISGTDCYCDDDAQVELNRLMDLTDSESCVGIHFFDNGNYHYNSKLWTDRVQEPFDLVIFDHHPDMQPPRFEGILSCGGWVKEVLDHNPFMKNVVLIGVADHLIDEINNEPSAEFEKYSDRVTFVPESALQNAGATSLRGNEIVETIEAVTAQCSENIYISIDKDALCLNDAVTNWDQGSLTFTQLEQTLRSLFASHKVLGVDICGERAQNQDFADGMDEGSADALNNELNKKLWETFYGL